MSSLSQLRKEGQASLKEQQIGQLTKEKIMRIKITLKAIDKFVADLVDVLNTPNSKGLFSSGKVDPADTRFPKCVTSIKNNISSVLSYRQNPPAQYQLLKSIFDNIASPSLNVKESYPTEPKIQFFYKFKVLMNFVPEIKSGECSGYTRLIELFNKKTDDGTSTIVEEIAINLREILSDFQKPELTAAIKEEIEKAFAERDIQIRYEIGKEAAAIPTQSSDTSEIDIIQRRLNALRPPSSTTTTTSSTTLEEPTAREGSETESQIKTRIGRELLSKLGAEKVSQMSPAKFQALIQNEYMQETAKSRTKEIRLSQLRQKLLSEARNQGKTYTSSQIEQAANNLYNKEQQGKGRRKTYRKKRLQRKSRKLRRA